MVTATLFEDRLPNVSRLGKILADNSTRRIHLAKGTAGDVYLA